MSILVASRSHDASPRTRCQREKRLLSVSVPHLGLNCLEEFPIVIWTICPSFLFSHQGETDPLLQSLNSQVTYAFPLCWIGKGETWVGTWIPQKSTCSTCRQSDVCWPCQGTLALPGSEHFLPVGEAATTWTEGGAWRVGLKQHFGVSHLGLNLSSAASKMYDLSKSLNYSRPQFSHPQNGDAKSDY